MPSPLAAVKGIEPSSLAAGVSAGVRLRHLSTPELVLVLAKLSWRLCPQPSRTSRKVLDELADSAVALVGLPGRSGDQIGRASSGWFNVRGAG